MKINILAVAYLVLMLFMACSPVSTPDSVSPSEIEVRVVFDISLIGAFTFLATLAALILAFYIGIIRPRQVRRPLPYIGSIDIEEIKDSFKIRIPVENRRRLMPIIL